MADSFSRIHHSGAVQGIFLSSGVMGNGVTTQDRLLDTAEILRNRMGYQGYLHLKIMPGAEKEQVRRGDAACRPSFGQSGGTNNSTPAKAGPAEDAVGRTAASTTLGGGNPPYGARASGLERALALEHHPVCSGGQWMNRMWICCAPSEYLTHSLHLKRVYFSAVQTRCGIRPFEGGTPLNLWRQSRLYQASFLIRDYGFTLEEFPFAVDGNLPLNLDPKLAWAQLHLAERPVDLEQADVQDLIRCAGHRASRRKGDRHRQTNWAFARIARPAPVGGVCG